MAPRESPAAVSFSPTGAGVLADLDTGSAGTVGLGAPVLLGAPAVDGGTAAYPVAGSDPASVQVSTTSDGFAAHVVLPSAPAAAPTYTFPLHLGGLTPSLSGGQLWLRDASGVVVAASAPLTMWDSHTDAAGDADHVADVDASLVSLPGGGTGLRLRPAVSFLSDPATEYPVTVDPDIESYAPRSADTFVSSTSPDTNYSSNYASLVGLVGGGNKRRSFEKFDIDQYIGKNVTSASLNMYEYYAATCASVTTNLNPVESPSSTALTWNNQPSPNTKARYAATFTGNAGGVGGGCGGGAMEDIDVTNMVNGFTTGDLKSDYDGGGDSADHVATIELQAADESSTDSDKRFCSFNTGNAPAGHNCAHQATDAHGNLYYDRQASLSVTYAPDLGEKGYYSTTDHKLDDHTTLKVNNENGNALLEADDVDIKGLGMDLKVTRYYNSLADDAAAPTSNLSMGPKWSLSVGSDVRMWRRSAYRYDYVSPSGAVYAGFTRQSDDSSDPDYNKFHSPMGGVGADLTQNSDGTLHLLYHSSRKEYVFSKVDSTSDDLYLSKVTDRSGNSISYTYATGGHQLASVADASGHTVSVDYVGGRVKTITDTNGPSTRVWKYTYVGGQLTAYTDPAGNVTNYAWTSGTNPQVATITDPVNNSGRGPRPPWATPTPRPPRCATPRTPVPPPSAMTSPTTRPPPAAARATTTRPRCSTAPTPPAVTPATASRTAAVPPSR